MKQEKIFVPNIAICILMDLVGMATYFFPGLGEFADIVWAPISGYIFYKLFGGRFGIVGGGYTRFFRRDHSLYRCNSFFYYCMVH